MHATVTAPAASPRRPASTTTRFRAVRERACARLDRAARRARLFRAATVAATVIVGAAAVALYR